MGRRLTALIQDLADGARENGLHDLAADLDRFASADRVGSGYDTTSERHLVDRLILAFVEPST